MAAAACRNMRRSWYAGSRGPHRGRRGPAVATQAWSNSDSVECGISLQLAREQLSRQCGYGSQGRGNHASLWAEPGAKLCGDELPAVGSVLLAHPSWDDAFARTGLIPPPPGASRRELARRPVVLITSRDNTGTNGIVLGDWSGDLLGDYDLDAFQTRPLYIGGPMPEDVAPKLTILHSYPEMVDAVPITPDGLALSNSFKDCCDYIDTGPASSMRFKFFVRSMHWSPEEEIELDPKLGLWLPTRCSRDLILREPDDSFEEPLWAQIVEHAGGELEELARDYGLLF